MGGVRPNITPLAGSDTRTVEAPADAVTRAIKAALDSSGVPVVAFAADEGYVETAWMDARTHAVRAPGPANLGTTIKIRFFADPVAGQTRLVAECVRRYLVDPSLPARELEQVLPEDHPGRLLMDSVLTRVLTSQRQPGHVLR
jgi:hypothetical protein